MNLNYNNQNLSFMNFDIRELFAERIGGSSYGTSTEIYKFERIKRAKKAALEKNPNGSIIDLGVGEPDAPAFSKVIKQLQIEAEKSENRIYADNGGNDFKEAAVRYMKNRFDVSGLDPKTEVMHSIGSKAALSMLPSCFINPGDYVIMTSPGYPIFGTHSKYYGGKVHTLPLLPENNFLPDLTSIPQDILEKSKVLLINFPNNPTGAVATRTFFEEVIAFAKKHKLIVIQDAAYAGLPYDGKALSILQVDGAKDIALELHSLSKSHNMTGWRIGFVAGNSWLVRAYSDVKDNTDSGQFLAIQKAAAVALDDLSIPKQIAEKYSRRFDLMLPVLQEAGFSCKKPQAGFFLYTAIPQRAVDKEGKETLFSNAEAFSEWMITHLLVSTVPWDDAGHYVRFSATFQAPTEADEKSVIEELGKRFRQWKFIF